MRLERLLNDRDITIYWLAERCGLSYSVVHNIVKGKSDIKKCALDTALRISEALYISVEDLALLCDDRLTFTLFKSEQCHLVHRKGELDYLIDVLTGREIDRYWRLAMYPEAFYELAMIDYICRRNDIPRCENYNEMRQYKLESISYPIDVLIKDDLLSDGSAKVRAEDGAIPEFRRFNIVEPDTVRGREAGELRYRVRGRRKSDINCVNRGG